jgi:predicted transcriptional regulator
MSRNVITVTEDMSLTALLNHFETHGLKRMPIIKDGMIFGSVDRQDLLRALVAFSEEPADSNSEKNVQQNEFVDLFSAN